MDAHHDEIGLLVTGQRKNCRPRQVEADREINLTTGLVAGRNHFFQTFLIVAAHSRLLLPGNELGRVQQDQLGVVFFRQGERIGKRMQ